MSTTTVGNLYYVGGNQVIGDYTSGQKIIFDAMYTGANFDGAGNFIVGSNLGALAIQNARDKIIDLSDAAGNTFVTAYEATNPGVIDFRIAAGYEIISGSAAGADIFMCGRFFGGEVVLNAAVVLADGSAFRFNHVTQSRQGA